MPLNRKACINVTTEFIARDWSRKQGGIVLSDGERSKNPDTFERCFSSDHFRPEARGESRWRLVSIFSESIDPARPHSISHHSEQNENVSETSYGRENIEQLTQFRILETISRIFFMQFLRLTAHMTNKIALSNGVGRRVFSIPFRFN